MAGDGAQRSGLARGARRSRRSSPRGLHGRELRGDGPSSPSAGPGSACVRSAATPRPCTVPGSAPARPCLKFVAPVERMAALGSSPDPPPRQPRPTAAPASARAGPPDAPCEIQFLPSVDDLVEPVHYGNFTQFSLSYILKENVLLGNGFFKPVFGGHQSLGDREETYHAKDQTLHCGFVRGPDDYPSTGFDLDENDRRYMATCHVAVSSCIFGSSDYLRRPTKSRIGSYAKKNVCFVMFMDELTLATLSSEGQIPDGNGFIGLWRSVVVKNLPYEDMRRAGKVPKFLAHRLFPSAMYSIWLDSKLRLHADPMLIIEYFLWRKKSEYAISMHYDRSCVWEEVLQNKRLNKYNHTAIDEQFHFYQSDGLVKFNNSGQLPVLPSYVPEGSFIVRAHTPMSNLFSCLWFNEVNRFTSRDQLSFTYTYLKLRRTNPGKPFHLNMFKDCERRAIAKLFHHRTNETTDPPPANLHLDTVRHSYKAEAAI